MATRKRVNPYYSEDELNRSGRKTSQLTNPDDEEMPFVKITRAAIGVIFDAIQRVGSATIGPNFTGNARGMYAFDLQAERRTIEMVASGDNSIALGNNNIASGNNSLAVGGNCEAVAESTAVGQSARAMGLASFAFGNVASAEADSAIAIGYGALSRIPFGISLAGLIAIRQTTDGETEGAGCVGQYGGAEVAVATPLIDLKQIADFVIPFPAACKFFLTECGIILTHLTALTTQPTVRFGVNGSLAVSLAPFLCTDLNVVGATERFLPGNRAAGVTSLSFGVTSAAVATVLQGRAYWKGILVEDEV